MGTTTMMTSYVVLGCSLSSDVVLATLFYRVFRAATRKHTRVGQNYFQGDNARLGREAIRTLLVVCLRF